MTEWITRWWDAVGEVLTILIAIEVAIALVVTVLIRVSREKTDRSWRLLLWATCASPVILCLVGTPLPNRPRNLGVLAGSVEIIVFFGLLMLPAALLFRSQVLLEGSHWLSRIAVSVACLVQIGIDLLAILAAAQMFSGVSL